MCTKYNFESPVSVGCHERNAGSNEVQFLEDYTAGAISILKNLKPVCVEDTIFRSSTFDNNAEKLCGRL